MPIDITIIAISSSISVMPSSERKRVFSLLTRTDQLADVGRAVARCVDARPRVARPRASVEYGPV